jgi:hypothetical protein
MSNLWEQGHSTQCECSVLLFAQKSTFQLEKIGLSKNCSTLKSLQGPAYVSIPHVIDEGSHQRGDKVYINEDTTPLLEQCDTAEPRYTPRPVP